MKGFFIFALCLACVVLIASAAWAQLDYVKVLKQGVNGYTGATDTYIDRDNPTSNFGTLWYIHTYRMGSTVDRSGLFKFDLTGQIPQNAVITSATLSVWVYQLLDFDSNDWVDIGPYRVGQYRDWVETQATWNVFKGSSYWSSPGCEYVPYDRAANPDSTIRFYQSSAVNRYYDWNVTASVQAWYAGTAANNGWLMRIAANDGSGGEGISFYSKEYSSISYRPYLTINYTIIPEPSGLLALCTGVLGLLAMRRKK